MKNIKKYLVIFILILFAGTAFGQSSKYKIIVNKENSVTSVSKSKLSDIFLKKTKKWDDGSTAIPVDQVADSDTREVFTKDIHGKSVSAIKAYWQKKIFTGKGIPPVELKSDNEIIDFVRSNPGAVAYVSSGANTAGVIVVEVTK